jgi:hypothetical protein
MLTRTNYHEWAMLMHVTFEVAGWWYVVEPEEDEVINYRHDRLALTAILRSVLADMLSSLHERRSSVAAAWEAIKRIRIGVQRVREVNAQQIRREFGALVWKEAETTEDFVNRITGLAVELCLLGNNITDTEVVWKMLQVMSDDLTQVAVSIETLLDIKTITVEEVTSMLRTVEQRRKPAVARDSQDWLLLCEEEWMARLKLCEFEAKGGGSSSSNASGRRHDAWGKGRGRGNGDGTALLSRDGNKPKSGNGLGPTKKDQCKRCGKFGHWARDCRSKPKAKARVA